MADLLILIPAFNEARAITAVITDVRRVLPQADILVVNDGSEDATATQARSAGACVVSHPWNLGYGAALQTGYKYAAGRGYRLLVQIDGDGQHHAESIPSLLTSVENGDADFVIGSRFHEGDSYAPSWPRRVGMALFSRLVSLLLGEKFRDTTSGFQAFNARVIDYLTTEVFPCDYPDADLLLILHRAGFRLRECPVTMSPDESGESMHGGLRPVYYIFKMFLSIGVTLLRSRPRLKGDS